MIKKVLLVFLILILNIKVYALDNRSTEVEFYEDITQNEELISQYGIIESEEELELVDPIEEENIEVEKTDNKTFDIIFIVLFIVFIILLIITIIEIVKERRKKNGQYGF